MAELNGAHPVEGTYRQHLIDQLRDSEDEDENDESVSNAYESVREDAWDLLGTTADKFLVHIE